MVSIGYNKYLGLNIPFLDYGQGKGYIPIEKKTIGVGGFVGTGTVVSGWNALSTTGKVAVGAGAGATVYAGYDWLFGGKKAAAPITQNPVIQQAPSQGIDLKPNVTNINKNISNQLDYSQNPIYNISSPGSYISTEKKQGMSAPFNATNNTPFEVSPLQSTSAKQDTAATSGGTDWATLAAIAGVALVAYGYTSRKSK